MYTTGMEGEKKKKRKEERKKGTMIQDQTPHKTRRRKVLHTSIQQA